MVVVTQADIVGLHHGGCFDDHHADSWRGYSWIVRVEFEKPKHGQQYLACRSRDADLFLYLVLARTAAVPDLPWQRR